MLLAAATSTNQNITFLEHLTFFYSHFSFDQFNIFKIYYIGTQGDVVCPHYFPRACIIDVCFLCFVVCYASDIHAHILKFLKCHPIRAKLPDELLQPAHASTSISAMILSISARRVSSRATIWAISALSAVMSTFSRVSSAST